VRSGKSLCIFLNFQARCFQGIPHCCAVHSACTVFRASSHLFPSGCCRKCTEFATSPNASTVVTNCSCLTGYDLGDGETRQVYTVDDICTLTMEVTIVTAQVSDRCWSNSNSSPPTEYCDSNAGTQNDVWVRVQWGLGNQSPLRFTFLGAKIDSGYSRSEVIVQHSSTVMNTQERMIDAGATTAKQFELNPKENDPWTPASPMPLPSTIWFSTSSAARLALKIPDAVLASNVIFPVEADLREGVLWHFWGNIYACPGNTKLCNRDSKAWLGIRQCTEAKEGCNGESFFYLRVRAGKGTAELAPHVDASKNSTQVAWIDTRNFPQDGLKHQVVVQVTSEPLRLRLWIDGVEKGMHIPPAASPDDQQYLWTSHEQFNRDPGLGNYGVSDETSSHRPAGEPHGTWPGAIASGLRIFVRTTWVECDGSVLDGDWVLGPVDELAAYCPPTSGLDPPVWSSWYALYQDGTQDYDTPIEPGRGFSFAASGDTSVALLPGLPGGVLGNPIAVEYYVSGSDAWRPASLSVRFLSGVPYHGISNASFSTRGELCWVDSDGQLYEQSALGCHMVGQSARATLFEEGFASTSKGAVSVGLYSSPRSPDSKYALLAEDQTSRVGATRYLLQSDGHDDDWSHEYYSDCHEDGGNEGNCLHAGRGRDDGNGITQEGWRKLDRRGGLDGVLDA
jgi:hypothetical protein